ncbi:hypothetical protein [Halobacterium zhouii]|uniref:hypothetical protein n=1 Tax=Halobacterium zhouii TaxID=2902624 RepID=UPI001E3D1916|nr:hypothetical protein [Halobacterium zhouii]
MADTERVWLVYREYTDKGMLDLTYATEDGERVLHRQRSLNAGDPTAAVEAEPDELEPADAEEQEPYRDEVTRMREQHAPEDVV